MPAAPIPADEPARLAALRDLGVLDTPPDVEFDALVKAVALMLDVPMATLTLVDEKRQWFKAAIGLPHGAEAPRELTFCGYTILGDELLEVPDATRDPRFSDNPFVTGPPDIRFYAGMPVRLSDGSRVGSICGIDCKPRDINDGQREVLRCLGVAAGQALENWRVRRLQQEITLKLRANEDRLRHIIDATEVGTWEWNLRTGEMRLNERWLQITGQALNDVMPAWFETRLSMIHPEDRARAAAALDAHLSGDKPYKIEMRIRHRDGHYVWVMSCGKIMTWAADGSPEWMLGTVQDIGDRKRQEEALRTREEFLERVGAVAGVGGWEVDLSTGVAHWSSVTYRLYGMPPTYQPTVEKGLDLFAPEARPAMRAAVKRAKEHGEPWDMELPFDTGDGRRIWVRTAGSVMFAGGKPSRIIGASQDVTDRVAEREALRAANERITLATDAGGIGIWDWNLANDHAVWDDWTYRLYGLAPGQHIQIPRVWQEAVHPDDLAGARQALRDALAGVKPFDTEFRVVWPDGSVHYHRASGRVTRDADGRAVRMVGVNRDVTQLRRLAEELARNAELQARAEAAECAMALFRNSAAFNYVVTVTERAGEPVFTYETVSPASLNVIGLPAADLVGREPRECFPADEAADVVGLFRACLAQGNTISYARSRGMQHGKREFEGSLSPIRHTATGRIARLAGTLHDVTERNRMQETLHQSQKMNAIGRLAAGVAHDFNNILQTMSSSLELVLDTAQPGTREHELLSIGLRSAGRGSSLTHQLLAYARKQMLEPRDVELRALLSDIEVLLARALDPRVVLEIWCESGVSRVRVDAGQLQTALLNLAINASHAMPDGGTLSIAARASSELGERWIVIAVTDSGTGMDETILAQALEPFFTTKGQEGTGLGLPMVQGFVEQSGGKFRIRSTPGVGTTIEMLLPPALDAVIDDEVAAPAPERRRTSGCVVLVDDDADVLVTTASFLEKAGFRVMRAANANQALTLLAGNQRIDALVSDFAMPGMNGLDLVAEARLRRPNLPAILISGFIDINNTGSIANRTVRLQKPFQRSDLIKALQDLMVITAADENRPGEAAQLDLEG